MIKKLSAMCIGLTMAFSSVVTPVALQAGSSMATGEELFRSIFFLQGQLAKDVPALSGSRIKHYLENDKDLNLRTSLIADRSIEAIRKTSPEFFTQFRAGIVSGDHVKTHEALKAGQELLASTLQQLAAAEQKIADRFTVGGGVPVGSAINFAYGVNVAVVLFVVGAVGVYLLAAIHTYNALWGQRTMNGTSFEPLQTEILTGQLVEKFAAHS